MAEKLRCAGEAADVTEDLLEFLEAVDVLGRDPARRESPQGQAFLSDTARLISDAGVSLDKYVVDAARYARASSEWSGDEWYSLCKRRSRIEFVRELYRELAPVDWDVSFMDVDDLDHVLRSVGQREGGVDPARIPPGTPHSHWWWWYPQGSSAAGA